MLACGCLTMIFTQWSRPPCQLSLSRYELIFFHSSQLSWSSYPHSLSQPDWKVGASFHAFLVSPSHPWVDKPRLCRLSRAPPPDCPTTAAMLHSLHFSPRLFPELQNCSSSLGCFTYWACPFSVWNPAVAWLHNSNAQGPPITDHCPPLLP